MSNGPYEDKKKGIGASVLLLNHYFQDVSVWDEAAIVARGKALFTYVKKTWPRPA